MILGEGDIDVGCDFMIFPEHHQNKSTNTMKHKNTLTYGRIGNKRTHKY
jgi:hypothetical protein